MDSFELNKIMGAVLGTLLFVMGVGFLAEAIYHPVEGQGPGYALPEPELVAGAPAEEAPAQSIGFFLASASAERGAAAARKCQSCHSFGEGEPNKMGPNLYNIVEASKAHAEGFAYSDILLQQKAEGQVWSYDNLNAFLTDPKAYAPGTKMNFAGVRSPEERADILAYLQTLSATPVAFPAAEDVAPAADQQAGAAADQQAGAAEDNGQSEEDAQIALLMASATAERGEAAARKCQSCHSFGEVEPNKMCPNLYNLFNGPKAHAADYAYSDILLQQKAEGQIWSFANLDAFLTDPKAHAPGTKMNFAGVRAPEERANIMAYMRSLSPDPVPLPGAGSAADAPAVDAQTTPAPEGTEPTAPAAATATPTTTSTETQVEGTPVGSGTPATESAPANPAPAAGAEAPATPAAPAQ